MTFARSRSPASRDRLKTSAVLEENGCYIGSVTRCPNCLANLEGSYCSACGQPRIQPGDLSARRFFHELTDEVATLHLKFKTLRSLQALVRPGLLTAEYLAGRRQRHLTPIQLYFVCAALFFLTAPFAGFTLASLMADDQSGDLLRLVSARAGERGLDPVVFSQRFDLRVQSVYTVALGTGAIAIALMLQLLFRAAFPFGVHLIFALHYFSFQYLITAAAGASRRFGLMEEVAAALAIGVTSIYLFAAMRRVYLGSLSSTLLKSAVLLVLTLAINYLADAGATRLTVGFV
jgi:hypothetical protein